MSRLCRLKSYQNIGDDGVWAYGEIVSLRQQLAEKDAERYRWLAAYLIGSDTIHDDDIVAANSKGELDTVIDAARGVK